MIETDKIVALIDAYAKDSDTSRTAFGTDVLNRPNFVHQLADGTLKSPGIKTINRVLAFLKEQGYELKD